MSMGPMPQQPRPEGATAVFVLGLLGLLACGILGIFAWIQGNEYLARCQAMGVEPEGIAVAGRIMGIVATALVALAVVGIAGGICLGFLGAAAG